jgi:hypothetical protein
LIAEWRVETKHWAAFLENSEDRDNLYRRSPFGFILDAKERVPIIPGTAAGQSLNGMQSAIRRREEGLHRASKPGPAMGANVLIEHHHREQRGQEADSANYGGTPNQD